MAYEETPHNVFTGLGQPDSTKLNPETGDSSYHYSGTVPKGMQSILGTISGIGGLLRFGGDRVIEGRPPPANMNNLEQPINNVSSLYNQNDTNQTRLASEDESFLEQMYGRLGQRQREMVQGGTGLPEGFPSDIGMLNMLLQHGPPTPFSGAYNMGRGVYDMGKSIYDEYDGSPIELPEMSPGFPFVPKETKDWQL